MWQIVIFIRHICGEQKKLLDTADLNQWYTLQQRPVVNFTNIWRAAFMSADPKSKKMTVNSNSFLRFQDLRA